MNLALSDTLAAWKSTLDARLNMLVENAWPHNLHAACRKGVAHGKRLRPLMLMSLVEGWGGSPLASLDAACSIELIHLANMIIESLPCYGVSQRMRLRPAIHEEFDEATAVATAYTLIAKAFEVASSQELLAPCQILAQVKALSAAMGPRGFAGSLVYARTSPQNPPLVNGDWAFHKMHAGALFHIVLETAANLTGQSLTKTNRAAELGEQLGIACSLLDEIHQDSHSEHSHNSLSVSLRRAQALHLLQVLRKELKESLRASETALQLLDYLQHALTINRHKSTPDS